MIDRSTNIKRALRQKQRGFIINPFRFGGGGGGGPGSHRYWRLLITLTRSASFAGATEVIFRNGSGTDVTTNGGVPTGKGGSSEINSGNAATNAFNGNTSSAGWISGGAVPQWVAVDLNQTHGSAQEIKTVDIYGSWNLPDCSPRDFEIQWSDNNSTWTTALTVTNEAAWSASELRTFNVF